jgi:hypothetical protein
MRNGQANGFLMSGSGSMPRMATMDAPFRGGNCDWFVPHGRRSAWLSEGQPYDCAGAHAG